MNVRSTLSGAAVAEGTPALLLALAVGVAAGMAATIAAGWGVKQIALVAAVAGLLVAAVISRRPLQVLICAWVVSLAYDRQYFSFEAVVGNWGPHGLYWVPSDALLALMFATWSYTAVVKRDPVATWGASLWSIFMPFALAVLASALGAGEPVPAIFEFLRIVKIGFVLWLLRRVLAPGTWNAVMLGLMLSVALQGVIGIAQVIAGDNQGLMALFGRQTVPTLELDDEFARISHRASGTTAHPNVFAPMLLMLVPGAWALAMGAPRGWIRRAAMTSAVLGLAGIVASLSRSPIALVIAALGLLVATMIALHLIDLRRVIVAGAVAGIAVGSAAYWQRDRIERRLFGDLERSVDFRTRYNEAAMNVWAEAPVFGVGANNFGYRLDRYAADLAAMNRENERHYDKIFIRTFAPVHNFYLLILSETGLVGISALTLLLAGTARIAFRAIRLSRGSMRLLCIGLGCGLVAQAGQQIGDFSLWNDVNLQTFAIILALLNAAPTASAAERAPP